MDHAWDIPYWIREISLKVVCMILTSKFDGANKDKVTVRMINYGKVWDIPDCSTLYKYTVFS